MATSSRQLPAFAVALNGLGDAETRKGELSRTHAQYESHHTAWQILLDAFEGDGGFLDGSYLWPFPREDNNEFVERQKMARYHNYLETLVDLYVRQVFTHGVVRTSKDEAYNQWLEDVDGAGTPIDDTMRRVAAMGLVGGSTGILVDKSTETPTGPRKADEVAQVLLTVFPNTDITDWRFSKNKLSGVKMLEAAPAPALVAVDPADQQQYLLWDREGWARFDMNGEVIDGALVDLGLVPLVIVRPKPSHISRMIGRPLVGNANIIRAMFNRCSEEDQVLRDQAFSVLTCSVPPEGNVEEAKASLGSVIGTAKALVVKGELEYKTPSMDVPGAIRSNMEFLTQELFRVAHVRFRRDSLAAETAEAIRLQHTELNEMLQGLGKALSQAERDIARCYYAWTEPNKQAAQTAFEKADPRATYPKEFFVAELAADLEAWALALEMDLGLTMSKRIKKRAVRRIEPEMDPTDLETVDREIDAQTAEDMQPTPTDTGDAEGDAIAEAQPNAA